MFNSRLNARPFDSEEEAIDAILHGKVQPGDAVFIRYEGPRGSGMPEMFYTGEAICSDPVLAASVGPDHRRPVLRRVPRSGDRSCVPGGGRRRPHRPC